jgi:beta-phosphoglucomutase-like phosphatase (HAD superfamily)
MFRVKTYGTLTFPPPYPRGFSGTELMGDFLIFFSSMFQAAHGCLSQVGIVSPKVTIMADNPRLRVGKPVLDPFLLATECLGYCALHCVIFEDSPSGIKAGITAEAIIVAICTSHACRQIEECGVHFVVENLEDVCCEEIETDKGTRLIFTVEH